MGNPTRKTYLCIILSFVLFGSMPPMGKFLFLQGLAPETLCAMRIFGAAICFWIAGLFIKKEKIRAGDWGAILLASLLGIAINQNLFLMGLKHTSPINAALITTTTPVLTLISSYLFFKEALTPRRCIGIAIALCGAATLVLANIGPSGVNGEIRGDILCIASQISFTAYLLLFRNFVSRYHPITLMKWLFLFSSFLTLPFAYDSLTTIPESMLSTNSLFFIVAIVFGSTFISYLLMIIAQRSLQPSSVSIFSYIQPIVAALLSVAMSVGVFGLDKLFSSALIVTGVYMVTRKRYHRIVGIKKVLSSKDANRRN